VPLVPRTRGAIMSQLLGFRQAHPDQLIVMAMNAHAEDRKALVQTGVAVFDDPVMATKAIAKLVKTGQAFNRAGQIPSASECAGMALADVRAALQDVGIAMAPEQRVDTEQAALEAFAELGLLVLKLATPAPIHRTELDGVRIGLSTEARVSEAFAELETLVASNAPDYPDIHIIAAPMVVGVEMLIGVRDDRHFGPLVLCGTGGVQTELFDDLVYRKAPISSDEAHIMIRATRGAAMFDGWRGGPVVNVNALADALVALSTHAAKLPSLEINPLIVTARNAIGVDLFIGNQEISDETP